MTPNTAISDDDDPIVEAFPVMIAAAQQLCAMKPRPDACFSYHRARAYSRRLGFHSVRTRTPYYLDSFQTLALRGGFDRVLISGTGDYSMLGNVLHAYRMRGVEPIVHVLDRCETPLFVNGWYANRYAAKITTQACDILEFDGGERFDVVATDHFLTRILPQHRARLMTVWFEALRRGGKIVITEPVPRDPNHRREDRSDRHERTRARVLQSLEDDPSIDISPEAAMECLLDYQEVRRSVPIGSLNELTGLFEAQGFVIDQVVQVPRRTAMRMHLIASKPM